MTKRYVPTDEEMNFAIKNARAILNQFFNHVSDMDVHYFRNALKARRDELYRTDINNISEDKDDEQPAE